jgi:AcrR family transcriptional regulator
VARAGLTVDRLVTAGAELADAEGFEAVTVSALARRFDVRPASVYSHLAGSDDLRARVALLALDELADRAALALAGRSGRDALVALADVYRDYAHEHPGRHAAAQLRLDPETAQNSAGPRHAAMARAVLLGYDVPEPDRTHAVRLMGSTIRGFIDLELGGSFDHSEPDAESSWRRTLDALDTLLHHWETP